MSISRLRLENTSFFNYLKYEVISPQFTELSSNESLVYSAAKGGYVAQSTVDPSPVSEGRGWVFFDDSLVGSKIVVDTTQEQSSKVSVTGASTYDVNYLTGTILNPGTTPTAVSYYWNYVSVIPRWPGEEPPPLPFVSFSIEGSEKTGFQLGGGTRNLRTVYIDIFATSSAERDDLSDVIHTALFNRSIPINDFSSGSYLYPIGTFNTDLSTPLDVLGRINFLGIAQKNIHIADDWSELHRYRSLVSGTYESFVDSV